MARASVTTRQLSVRLPAPLADALERESEASGLSTSNLVRLALAQVYLGWIPERDGRREGSVA